MKKPTPTKHYTNTLHQLCKLIPSHLTQKLARKHGVDKKARTFTPWSHVVSLLFAQLTHAIGLNDVCDTLRHHVAKLATIRGAVLIEKKTGHQFILTGSSARKLRRAGVNLLGGRALNLVMYPYMAAELGKQFDLDEALGIGMLPLVWGSRLIRSSTSLTPECSGPTGRTDRSTLRMKSTVEPWKG